MAPTRVTVRADIRRFLLCLPVALALIAGLLAMHTLTGARVSPAVGMSVTDSPAGVMTVGAGHAMSTGDEVTAVTGCDATCGDPMGMPDHFMLMMVCVLALLTAALVLLAPMLLARLSIARPRGPWYRRVRALLPHLRPPSLTVLSISRT